MCEYDESMNQFNNASEYTRQVYRSRTVRTMNSIDQPHYNTNTNTNNNNRLLHSRNI